MDHPIRRTDDYRQANISQDHAQLLRTTLARFRDRTIEIRRDLNAPEGARPNARVEVVRQLAGLILEAAKVLTLVDAAGTPADPASVPERPAVYACAVDDDPDDPTGLTARQKQVLDYLRDHVATRGYPPTLREIGLAMGIGSPNGVSCHLRSLVKKGLITRSRDRARGIKIL